MAHCATPLPRCLDCGGKVLKLNRPQVMGVLNVTPDSFSDGGKYLILERALWRARQMMQEGAAIIDVGGESTRPGAAPVSVEEELHRVIPVIEALSREIPIPLSVDTSKPEIMRAAVAAGAGFINDINALRQEGALAAASELGVPICLMHMRGKPQTMQQNPVYSDVVEEVREFLLERIIACEQSGIPSERLMLDPGFGFGKQSVHNLLLLKYLNRICELGFPVLVGLSRKSLIGTMLTLPVEERLYGGLALATLAAWQGATIVRTHDVQATMQALTLCDNVQKAEE
ncbi:dihydropteroate synthase [Nitrosococcus watsonii]|uniref:Dihydropteroate synthase n=1 Tax=Nitrosococcus watsoni (strain C-113) TaxID=105559 RepID=D8KAY1_NITWC|nr:dihydropteroate synthase [Nitrosococcus watsonii]ADJ27515.1 dihydropteroate synthase [Nitrosococcus watsonii C-113]